MHAWQARSLIFWRLHCDACTDIYSWPKGSHLHIYSYTPTPTIHGYTWSIWGVIMMFIFGDRWICMTVNIPLRYLLRYRIRTWPYAKGVYNVVTWFGRVSDDLAEEKAPANLGSVGFQGYEGLFVMQRAYEKCQAAARSQHRCNWGPGHGGFEKRNHLE